ncbi:uncharacterized protein LOC122881785 isoform X2 [Siniperca chuatsi]|uniref:uncharacterized protein LOC122881785 isoform X2 n=1 Tax=Siniperca chuatsi TaxID=119488 RepID=UPI001CE0396E|nr:uncharacterized protein LOC122881785 isoform X2 [Siniperca chuatsi]
MSRLPIKIVDTVYFSLGERLAVPSSPQTVPKPPGAAAGPQSPPELFHCFDPPHINRHDHQTGQADTRILPPPPEASCR